MRKGDAEDSCWSWVGAVSSRDDPYGTIYVGPGQGRDKAHRVSWSLHFGAVPGGLCVLHKCDNPPCTNPKHLFLGTNLDNIADKVSKGRQRNAPKIGEDNHYAKLTEVDVLEIRRLLAAGALGKDLAAQFDVDTTTISSIRNADSWKHIIQGVVGRGRFWHSGSTDSP